MHNAKNYAANLSFYTHQAMSQMQPALKLVKRSPLPTTEQEIAGYVDLLLATEEVQQPANIEYAMNEDVEHFMNVEEFLSSCDSQVE